MRIVEIPYEPVALYKVLKFEALVSSGGEAKAVISQGLVSVNGEIETRKRKRKLCRVMLLSSLTKLYVLC